MDLWAIGQRGKLVKPKENTASQFVRAAIQTDRFPVKNVWRD
jgi:hypothetical protein